MAKEIQLKATVASVARVFGKEDAKAVIMIPSSIVAEFPVGAVVITIQPLQSSMFGKDAKPTMIRGGKGPTS